MQKSGFLSFQKTSEALGDTSKAEVARDLLLKGFSASLLSILLEDYSLGTIRLKKLVQLAGIPPRDVLDRVVAMTADHPIPAEVDDYKRQVAEKVLAREFPP